MFKIFSKKQTETKHDFINNLYIKKPINEIFTLKGNLEFLSDRKDFLANIFLSKDHSCDCGHWVKSANKSFSLSENIDSDNLKNIAYFANLIGKDFDDIIKIKKGVAIAVLGKFYTRLGLSVDESLANGDRVKIIFIRKPYSYNHRYYNEVLKITKIENNF